MAKFRILKIEHDHLNKFTYIVQRKKWFGGWKTLDYFGYLGNAIYCMAKNNPNYTPKENEIVMEVE